MSGFVLQFNRDSSAIDPSRLDVAANKLQHRGHDGSRFFQKGCWGIVFQHFWTSIQERNTFQPHHHENGTTHFLFDGRLDNREAIRAVLGFTKTPANQSDSLLAFRYLSARGLDKAGDLVGPYVFAYIDMEKGKLWVARDPVGNRSVFYYSDSKTLLLASEEQALLPLVTTKPSLDHTATAHYFASVPCGENTFFSSVKELQPGWMLTCDAQSLHKFPFAFLAEPDDLLREEPPIILEQLTQQLSEAVSARLNSETSVGIMLSGGIDSSTIAALSNHQLRKSSKNRSLLPISYRFAAFQEADEGTEIQQFCQLVGLQPHFFDASTMRPFAYWQHSLPNPNTPEDNLYRPLLQKLYTMAAEHGCQVILSGDFGDNHFAGSHRWLVEALLHRNWLYALNNLKTDLRLHGLRTTLRRCGFGSKKHLRHQSIPPRYLTKYATSTWNASVIYHSFDQHPTIRQAALHSPLATRSFSREQYYAHMARIELRHPFRDRNLIALSIKLPSYYLYREGTKKWWLRKVRTAHLPVHSSSISSTKNLEPFYQACFNHDRNQILQALKNSEPIWSPWVEPEQVYQSISEPFRGPIPSYLWWLCLSFSKWYQQVF